MPHAFQEKKQDYGHKDNNERGHPGHVFGAEPGQFSLNNRASGDMDCFRAFPFGGKLLKGVVKGIVECIVPDIGNNQGRFFIGTDNASMDHVISAYGVLEGIDFFARFRSVGIETFDGKSPFIGGNVLRCVEGGDIVKIYLLKTFGQPLRNEFDLFEGSAVVDGIRVFDGKKDGVVYSEYFFRFVAVDKCGMGGRHVRVQICLKDRVFAHGQYKYKAQGNN